MFLGLPDYQFQGQPLTRNLMIQLGTDFLLQDLAARLDGVDHAEQLLIAAKADLLSAQVPNVDVYSWWVHAVAAYRRDPSECRAKAVLDGTILEGWL